MIASSPAWKCAYRPDGHGPWQCAYCRLESFAYCSGHIILGSLCSVWILEVYFTVTSPWKFCYESVCSVWSPDYQATKRCRRFHRKTSKATGLILGSVHTTGHGSWMCKLTVVFGLCTYHRGRLVVGNLEGVLTGTYRCGHGSWKCTYRCL